MYTITRITVLRAELLLLLLPLNVAECSQFLIRTVPQTVKLTPQEASHISSNAPPLLMSTPRFHGVVVRTLGQQETACTQ